MNNTPEWLQEFVLSLTGNEIFWFPILAVGLGLFLLWILPSIRGTFSTVAGWTSFLLLVFLACLTWFHVWDWRAEEYAGSLTAEVEGVELSGGTISASDISADQYGVITVDYVPEYDLGFSEAFLVNDVEGFIDSLVINYKTTGEGESTSFLHQMRDFQQLHINMTAGDDNSVNDILNYHQGTLVEYAESTALQSADDANFWEESNPDSDEESNSSVEEGTGLRVVREGLSPWDLADEQASDGGVSLGQWSVLSGVPGVLDSLNEVSCGVFNGFEECSEGKPQVYHSVLLAFGMMVLVLVGTILGEMLIRRFVPEEKRANVKNYIARHVRGRKVEEHSSSRSRGEHKNRHASVGNSER